MQFILIRSGITSTSVSLNMEAVNAIQRLFLSNLHGNGKEFSSYHLVAIGGIQDISATDYLKESGTTYDVINVRVQTGSHMELDLEPIHA